VRRCCEAGGPDLFTGQWQNRNSVLDDYLEFRAVEGHVNRIKLITHQMSGRAGFQFLRECV
jgi:hypothetical protein